MHPRPGRQDHAAVLLAHPSVEVVPDACERDGDGEGDDRQAEDRMEDRQGEDVEGDVLAELGVRLAEGGPIEPEDVRPPFGGQRRPEHGADGKGQDEAGEPRVVFGVLPVFAGSGRRSALPPAREHEVEVRGPSDQEQADGPQRHGPAPLSPENPDRLQLAVPLDVRPDVGDDQQAAEQQRKHDECCGENAQGEPAVGPLCRFLRFFCSGQPLSSRRFGGMDPPPTLLKSNRSERRFPEGPPGAEGASPSPPGAGPRSGATRRASGPDDSTVPIPAPSPVRSNARPPAGRGGERGGHGRLDA